MNKILKTLFLSLTVTTTMLSQQVSLPYLQQVEVRNAVQFDPARKIYSYSYSVKNGTTSSGKIDWFEIDVSKDSTSSATVDTVGLRFKNSRIENTYKRMYAEISNSVIPIGFPSLPQYGDAALTLRGTAMLMAKVITPGEEIRGFIVSSKGVPGIRSFVAVPPFDPYELYPRIEDVADPDSLNEVVERDREAINFHGITVGPTAPPINFIATIWCDTLLSYTRQSVELGWLKSKRDDDCDDDEQPNDGAVKNIEKRIEKAKKELMQGDSAKARKELEKLVKKVERIYKKGEELEKKKHKNEITMTSEAYALLKYNAEYLIERLPEKKSKKGEED